MSKHRIVFGALIASLFSLTLAVFACSPREKRDVSTPETALLGHWVTHEGAQKVNYYIDDENLVITIGDRSIETSYSVLESNNDENWIIIRVDMGDVGALDKRLSFSKNRNSITETVELFGNTLTNRWKYVDSRTAP